MFSFSVSRAIHALTLTLAVSGCVQASTLYSFGPDDTDDPRSFTDIDTTGLTSDALYNMNDTNDGFNGGVTYQPGSGLFYAIINDSSGNSSLISFSPGGEGAFTTLQSVGVGFSGLAFDTANNSFYGIALDSSGFSTLYKIVPGGATTALFGLGSGFDGGLTFDATDGNLYAISNDSLGNSTLNRITLGGVVTALTGTALGTGFLGGVVYDKPSASFFAIEDDSFGDSNLDQIDVSGSSVSSVNYVLSVGEGGFVNAGLTEAAPEPSTLWLFAGGLAFLLIVRHRGLIDSELLRRKER